MDTVSPSKNGPNDRLTWLPSSSTSIGLSGGTKYQEMQRPVLYLKTQLTNDW